MASRGVASLAALAALAALLSLLAVARAADFENCADSDDLGEFTKVEVSECAEGEAKCPLTRGHNVTITISLNAKKEAKQVHQVVHGIIANLPVPFPLDSPDACHGTGLECPLKVGAHTYKYALFVKPAYPKMSVKVKWELQNENKEQIVCVLIPAILK